MARERCKKSYDDILAYLKKHGQITAKEANLKLGQSRQSALLRLLRLENDGVVRVKALLPGRRNTMGPTKVFELSDAQHKAVDPSPQPDTVHLAETRHLQAVWR